jgi:ATP/maltotriose-dependent transcriptional regulator MalT
MYNALKDALPNITDRQRQVVQLIAAGCSNEEVGVRLGIFPRTAKAHCDVLHQKLGLTRRRQIPVARTVRLGRGQQSCAFWNWLDGSREGVLR